MDTPKSPEVDDVQDDSISESTMNLHLEESLSSTSDAEVCELNQAGEDLNARIEYLSSLLGGNAFDFSDEELQNIAVDASPLKQRLILDVISSLKMAAHK